MRRGSVLVIDDDLLLLRQMSEALARAGLKVQPASDGEMGLRHLVRTRFDLVVTDLIMPNREGLETIMAVRAGAPAAKILAISGGLRIAPYDFLNVAGMLGADACLAKPFRLSALVDTAQRLLAPATRAVAAQ